jgi:hypothetical protein
MAMAILQSAWNYEIICDKLGTECTNHCEENAMKKTVPATLKLEQNKLLGFRIQGAEQVADAEPSRKIGSKVGGKGENKIGAKVGSKPGVDARIGAKVGSKPTIAAKIGAKVGSKPV